MSKIIKYLIFIKSF